MQLTNVNISQFTLSFTNLLISRYFSCTIYALYIDSIVLISIFFMPLKSLFPLYQHLQFLCQWN